MHGLGRNQRALLARVDADVFLIAQVQERRQRAPRLDAALRHVLRDFEHVNRRVIRLRRLLRIDVGERGVGGAEVDADVHCDSALLDFDLGRRENRRPASTAGRSTFSAFQPLCRSSPPGAFPFAGTLPINLTPRPAGHAVGLRVGAFDAVDHRLQLQIPLQRFAAPAPAHRAPPRRPARPSTARCLPSGNRSAARRAARSRKSAPLHQPTTIAASALPREQPRPTASRWTASPNRTLAGYRRGACLQIGWRRNCEMHTKHDS